MVTKLVNLLPCHPLHFLPPVFKFIFIVGWGPGFTLAGPFAPAYCCHRLQRGRRLSEIILTPPPAGTPPRQRLLIPPPAGLSPRLQIQNPPHPQRGCGPSKMFRHRPRRRCRPSRPSLGFFRRQSIFCYFFPFLHGSFHANF